MSLDGTYPCDTRVAATVGDYIEALKISKMDSSIVVAIQGVQGVGKTHLCTSLESRFRPNWRTTILSLDDFYKSRVDMGMHTTRGRPGTHDIHLLAEIIDSLVEWNAPVRLPVYDKTALGGLGNRVGWREIKEAPDIVIVEGWCIGFAADGVDDALNQHVREYEDLIMPRLNALVVLKSSLSSAYAWRERAEESIRQTGRGAMTSEQIVRFVDHYKPVYERYLGILQRSNPIETTLHVQTADPFGQ